MVVSEGMSEAMRRLGEACLSVNCPPPMPGAVPLSGCGGKESLPGSICWLVCRVWVGCCRVGGLSAFETAVVHKRRSIATPQSHDTTSASRESIGRMAVMAAWALPSGILRGDARAHGLELHMGPCHRRRGCRGPTEVPVGWLHVSYSPTSLSTVPEVGCHVVSSQS